MAVKLQKSVLPAKKSGRKPKATDPELIQLLVDALNTAQIVEGRPEIFGPTTMFETEGKATAEARRYVNVLTGTVKGSPDKDAPFFGQTISVRSIDAGPDKDGNGRYQWAIYKRVSDNGDSAES